MSHSPLTRREYAQQLNAIIDQALLEPTAEHQQQLIQRVAGNNVTQLGERLRQRATRLGKTRRDERARLLSVRDELMQAVYARTSSVDSGGYRVLVGYFDSGGLSVDYYSAGGVYDYLGLSSARLPAEAQA